MKYTVVEKIKYPSNLHTQEIASFAQPSDAVKFAKDKAKDRNKYDSGTPFCYSVIESGKPFNQYFNHSIL